MTNLSGRHSTPLPNRVKTSPPDGSPLGVCINDCEIDYGQPPSELAKTCFALNCAFAQMRWGGPPSNEPNVLPFQKKHLE